MAETRIDHLTPDCVGYWRLTGTRPGSSIRCELCGVQYAGTPANKFAAIDENFAGVYLRRLTREGAPQLESGQDGAR